MPDAEPQHRWIGTESGGAPLLGCPLLIVGFILALIVFVVLFL